MNGDTKTIEITQYIRSEATVEPDIIHLATGKYNRRVIANFK